MNTLATVSTLIIYCVGAVAMLGLLACAALALAWAFTFACDGACKQILRYRRLSYLHYWSERLEGEGLLPLDAHYRAVVTQSGPPTTVQSAQQRERQAREAEEKAAKAAP